MIKGKNAKISIGGIPLSNGVSHFELFKREEVNRTTSIPGQKILDEIRDSAYRSSETLNTTMGSGMFGDFEFKMEWTKQAKDATVELHQNKDGVWTK